jgi:hypothetical protein
MGFLGSSSNWFPICTHFLISIFKSWLGVGEVENSTYVRVSFDKGSFQWWESKTIFNLAMKGRERKGMGLLGQRFKRKSSVRHYYFSFPRKTMSAIHL